MLRPVLLVGVGGSGGKTLRAMRQSLIRQLKQAGWTKDGLPEGWQMRWVDSVSQQDEDAFVGPLLPNDDYIGLVTSGLDYQDLRVALEQSVQPRERQNSLAGWVAPSVPISVTAGAGQARAIGRVISAAQLARLKGALEESNARLGGVSVLAELAEVASLFGQSDSSPVSEPLCIVISSVAGGSGSGMFLDVVEALKTVNPEFQRPDGIMTVLYTPDVFTNIGGAGGQIPPNTLAAIMEATAGVLSPGLSSASTSVLNSRGLVQRSEHGFGAKCNFLVGASNKNVVLGSQDAIYQAVGDSLGAVVTDDKVQQTLRAFTLTNVFLMSGNSMLVEDRSLLSEASDTKQSMPFSALGMGRMTLGTDRLSDYIAQLVSRDITAQLLWPDLDKTAGNDGVKKTREERIEERVAQTWEQFLNNSGLNERDTNDEIIDALVENSQLESRLQQWAGEGLNRARQGVGEGGLPPADWAARLQTYFDNHLPTLLAQESANRYELAQKWTESLSNKLTTLVSETSMRNGLVVVERLLERLIDEMVFVKDELKGEAETERTKQLMMAGRLQQTLNVGANKLDVNDDAVNKAVSIIRIGAMLEVNADRLLLGSTLVDDLTDGLLRPILSAVQFSRARLSAAVNSSKLDDGTPNNWAILPEYDRPVPTQLLPGATERVMIEANTYLSVLEEEAKACLTDGQDKSAWRMVLRERAALGQEFDTGKERGKSVLRNTVGWVPRDAQATQARVSGIKAEFSFPANVADIQASVEAWLSNVELSAELGRFLKQGLVDYVESGAPAQQIERQNQLISAFTSAISIASPFVSVNPAVKAALHPNVSDEVTSIVSTIPFVEGHPLHVRLKNALVNAGFWSDSQSPNWFGTAKVDKISVFTMSGKAMMPMVFDNIMKPIAQSWASNSGNPAKRHSFWASRRARPLTEFIPAGHNQIEAMARGWFLSALLNQRTIVDENDSGWRVSVWEPGSRAAVDFPFPLLSSQPVGRNELPAAIFKSLAIAMVKVNEASSLSPLLPYQRLMSIGDLGNFRKIIELWVREGQVNETGAPTPDAKISGPADGSLEERRVAVMDTLTKSRDMYINMFAQIVDSNDPYTTPSIWEVRDYVLDALDQLLKVTESVRDDQDVI